MTNKAEREGVDWHWGPDPAFGNLCKHIGPKASCSGPDCGSICDACELPDSRCTCPRGACGAPDYSIRCTCPSGDDWLYEEGASR